ncbi:hypothetical protein RB594_003540 [Gaeumannomyces avenae]
MATRPTCCDISNNNTMASGQPAAGSTEKADFGDKAFDFASKKAGHPVDRNAGEKITDAARNVYEKATGKKVNPKISN